MRARLLDFIQALRVRGVEVSTAEALDAVAGVAAAGVEREVLREALAACLVKDEDDRPTFDALFEEIFPAVGPGGEEGRRRKRVPGAGGGAVPTGRGGGTGESTGARRSPDTTPQQAGRAEAERTRPRPESEERRSLLRPGAGLRERPPAGTEAERGSRVARRRRLLALPFRDFTSRDVEEARALVQELGARLRGRLARRERRGRTGRLDFRRTIRASMSSGGVPVSPRWRRRRPGRPDLVALCDLSGSVGLVSELLLGLLAPAADYFRRVRLFAYVDRLCPVSIEHGHVAPGGPLDLHARSDLGRVLLDLWEQSRDLLTRSTLLLVLGDARNNWLPPRADLFRTIADRVQRIVWLVPEPQSRWDTGDSVLRLYTPASDAVLECLHLDALIRAVRRIL
jgi:uncharacterized protein with von Willebrand factor type A (vWA) domain